MNHSGSTADPLPAKVRRLYPFEGRALHLSCGHRMHFLDEGAGTPVLMLHGNPTWSFYYRRLVLALRDDHRCLVPDHIGCGLSDKPREWSYTIEDHVANLCELVSALDLRDVTLAVHDWGGTIGYLTALRMPDRFGRFVVFNTAVKLLPLPRWLLLLRSRAFGRLLIQGLNLMVRGGLRAASIRYPHAVRTGYLAPYDSWSHRIALRRFVEEIPIETSHPNRRLMAELEVGLPELMHRPHLVVWGMRDPVFHQGYLDSWRALVPDAEIHRMEEAGHWVVEDEHAAILPLVRDFLIRTA